MWTPGTTVSAIGHAGFIGWLLLGWGLSADPLPFDVTQVSVVSGEEYAALVAATSPDAESFDPQAPVVPTEDTPPDAVEDAPDVAPVAETPDAVPLPAEDTAPPDAPSPPAEPAELTDSVAVPQAPSVGEPDLPVSDTPQEAQADRIASVPTAPPPPDVDTAAVVQDQTSPDAAPDAPEVETPLEEAAPEDTATAIVPEDATPSGAVETSLRPSARPARPTPPAPAETEPETDTADASDDATDPAVAAALEAATTAATSANVPQGPPMTGSERDGFRVAVNACWNVDPGSVAARVTVEVGFSLDQNGRVSGDVRLLSSNGDNSATQTAFQAARRAILRCQTQSGYDLPAEKYGQWKDVVITFDPSGMRLR
ncbi:energy transducer TonB [Yoonia sp. 208BN28-4]|uniref:energy transducer TonB n=1 Tax=Yoonia sp. 208BN28-4 TaxID=3126505 RepID=UPI0030A856D4